MEDLSFLQFFITEDIYVRPEDIQSLSNERTPISESLEAENSYADDLLVQQTEKLKKVEVEKLKEVEVEKKETPVSENTIKEEKSYTPPVFEGYFLKKTLIVVHTSGLNFEHKELLLKILGAIKLQKEDVAILPTGHIKSKEDFEWMINSEKNNLIAFGLPDKWKQQITSNMNSYEVIQNKGYQLIFSESLAQIASNVDAKKHLWQVLQKI